jgi:hypothetical protein
VGALAGEALFFAAVCLLFTCDIKNEDFFKKESSMGAKLVISFI